jgi:hypothetical protein
MIYYLLGYCWKTKTPEKVGARRSTRRVRVKLEQRVVSMQMSRSYYLTDKLDYSIEVRGK